jgi:hypothetical protein
MYANGTAGAVVIKDVRRADLLREGGTEQPLGNDNRTIG